MNTMQHNLIVAALEQQHKGKDIQELIRNALRQDGLHAEEGGGMATQIKEEWIEAECVQQEEQEAVLQQVGEEMLCTHGDKPGPKKDGVFMSGTKPRQNKTSTSRTNSN